MYVWLRIHPRPTIMSDLTLHFAPPSSLALCLVPFSIRIFLSTYIHNTYEATCIHTYIHTYTTVQSIFIVERYYEDTISLVNTAEQFFFGGHDNSHVV